MEVLEVFVRGLKDTEGWDTGYVLYGTRYDVIQYAAIDFEILTAVEVIDLTWWFSALSKTIN